MRPRPALRAVPPEAGAPLPSPAEPARPGPFPPPPPGGDDWARLPLTAPVARAAEEAGFHSTPASRAPAPDAPELHGRPAPLPAVLPESLWPALPPRPPVSPAVPDPLPGLRRQDRLTAEQAAT